MRPAVTLAPATVFVPEGASAAKIHAIRSRGPDVLSFGRDCVESEVHARAFASEHGMTYISPYNDLEVIAGQGTIAVELVRQLNSIDAVFVAVGGGGLLAGTADCLKAKFKRNRVIACSPERSAVMYESLKAGRILQNVQSLETLSDGTAGGVEVNSITFGFCQSLIDEFVLVTEDEIKSALREFMRAHRMIIEGAAGVVVAAFLKMRDSFRSKNVVLIICGGNMAFTTLKSILMADENHTA